MKCIVVLLIVWFASIVSAQCEGKQITYAERTKIQRMKKYAMPYLEFNEAITRATFKVTVPKLSIAKCDLETTANSGSKRLDGFVFSEMPIGICHSDIRDFINASSFFGYMSSNAKIAELSKHVSTFGDYAEIYVTVSRLKLPDVLLNHKYGDKIRQVYHISKDAYWIEDWISKDRYETLAKPVSVNVKEGVPFDVIIAKHNDKVEYNNVCDIQLYEYDDEYYPKSAFYSFTLWDGNTIIYGHMIKSRKAECLLSMFMAKNRRKSMVWFHYDKKEKRGCHVIVDNVDFKDNL